MYVNDFERLAKLRTELQEKVFDSDIYQLSMERTDDYNIAFLLSAYATLHTQTLDDLNGTYDDLSAHTFSEAIENGLIYNHDMITLLLLCDDQIDSVVNLALEAGGSEIGQPVNFGEFATATTRLAVAYALEAVFGDEDEEE